MRKDAHKIQNVEKLGIHYCKIYNFKEEQLMKVKLAVCVIVALCLFSGVKVYAREQKHVGKGSVEGFVQFFNQDISYLESELNSLMSECGRE